MRHRIYRFISVALAWSAVLGCGGKASDTSDDRTEYDPAQAAVVVNAEVLRDEGGVIDALYKVASQNTQRIDASTPSGIEGAFVLIQPGSFDIDQTVSLEEGGNLAFSENLKQLLAADVTVEARGPVVYLTWTYDELSMKPVKLTIPGPGPDTDPDQFAVVYLKNVPEQEASKLGILGGSSITAAGDKVQLETDTYGLYQAVALSSKLSSNQEVVTKQKGEKISQMAGKAPGAFAITGPADELLGPGPLITWDSANGATTYKVAVSTNDSACSDSLKTWEGLIGESLKADKIATGVNYVCVAALNSAGTTWAINNGYTFTADVSGPERPGKPVHDGPVIVDVGVEFRWTEVKDVGSAGVVFYHLEAGKTPGSNELFNGPVTGTSKVVLGESGDVIYARVKAVDAIGNESEWSEVSAPAELRP